MIGARSSGHLSEEQLLASAHAERGMSIDACLTRSADHRGSELEARWPARWSHTRGGEPSVTQSQLRHGLVGRLCIPCRSVVGPLSIAAWCDIGSEAHLFLRQRWCLLARPKWIRRLHEWIHLHIAIHK